MHILAIETSTQACSAALLADNIIIEEFKIAPSEHSKLILSMIDSVLIKGKLQLSDLDCIAFGAGPGSFIGVRIAASLVQGLAYGVAKPVVSVSSLQTLAQNIVDKYNVKRAIVAIDARMQQIYHGLFELDRKSIMQLVGIEEVSDTVALKKQCHDDLKYYIAGGELFPTAGSVAKIAANKYQQDEILEATQAVPSYIRNVIV